MAPSTILKGLNNILTSPFDIKYRRNIDDYEADFKDTDKIVDTIPIHEFLLEYIGDL